LSRYAGSLHLASRAVGACALSPCPAWFTHLGPATPPLWRSSLERRSSSLGRASGRRAARHYSAAPRHSLCAHYPPMQPADSACSRLAPLCRPHVPPGLVSSRRADTNGTRHPCRGRARVLPLGSCCGLASMPDKPRPHRPTTRLHFTPATPRSPGSTVPTQPTRGLHSMGRLDPRSHPSCYPPYAD